MDAQVARRAKKELADLLDEFVCVRAVEMEGVDLSLFQFDYDQSWAAFFLNADRTIYGRYGTRADDGADDGVDISVAGFVRALEGALQIHAGYPGNKALLAGKRGAPLPASEIRSFPLFKSRFAEAPPRGCAHCHYVWEALRSVPRDARKELPDDLMWPFPKPDRLGLELDIEERATVSDVAAGSAAARAGFEDGDRILTLGGQAILSIADVQWVLQNAPTPSDLRAEIDRGGERKTLTLRLTEGWRVGEDITWRPSTGLMRPFGWQAANPLERKELGVPDGALCVRVKGIPPARAGQKAGLRVGDYILAIDGSTKEITEEQWLEYLHHEKVQDEPVTLTVVHEGRQKKLILKAP